MRKKRTRTEKNTKPRAVALNTPAESIQNQIRQAYALRYWPLRGLPSFYKVRCQPKKGKDISHESNSLKAVGNTKGKSKKKGSNPSRKKRGDGRSTSSKRSAKRGNQVKSREKKMTDKESSREDEENNEEPEESPDEENLLVEKLNPENYSEIFWDGEVLCKDNGDMLYKQWQLYSDKIAEQMADTIYAIRTPQKKKKKRRKPIPKLTFMQRLRDQNNPKRLWLYGLKLCAKIPPYMYQDLL